MRDRQFSPMGASIALLRIQYSWNHHGRTGGLIFLSRLSDRQLTKSLLWRDFDLEINLPDDRLCPPVSLCLFRATNARDLCQRSGRWCTGPTGFDATCFIFMAQEHRYLCIGRLADRSDNDRCRIGMFSPILILEQGVSLKAS